MLPLGQCEYLEYCCKRFLTLNEKLKNQMYVLILAWLDQSHGSFRFFLDLKSPLLLLFIGLFRIGGYKILATF